MHMGGWVTFQQTVFGLKKKEPQYKYTELQILVL